MDNSFYNDLHVHTNLSYCAPQSTTIESYIPYCEKEGVKVLGISNHIYFEKDSARNALSIKDDIKRLKDSLPCKVLVGAEVETVYHLEPNLTREQSKNFDYLLLACSHVMNIRSMYRDYDLSSADKIRDLLVKNFKRACSFKFEAPVGICHPLYPICSGTLEEEIVNGIKDEELSSCFALAKKNDISIEIHACLYRNGTKLNKEGISNSYLRFLKIAKAEGCKFHFGSDAHTPEAFIDRHKVLFKVAKDLGLSKNDVWEIGR